MLVGVRQMIAPVAPLDNTIELRRSSSSLATPSGQRRGPYSRVESSDNFKEERS